MCLPCTIRSFSLRRDDHLKTYLHGVERALQAVLQKIIVDNSGMPTELVVSLIASDDR